MGQKKQAHSAQTAKDSGENVQAQKKKQAKEILYINRF
jgi:hypothetical protein